MIRVCPVDSFGCPAFRLDCIDNTIMLQGDAEDLPFPADAFDRYVSAGSIEYWPEPQRGICEAYRVTRNGGIACIIGPVHPTFWLSRLFADMWMLFPTEDEYTQVGHLWHVPQSTLMHKRMDCFAAIAPRVVSTGHLANIISCMVSA